jgi:hypothetical protein
LREAPVLGHEKRQQQGLPYDRLTQPCQDFHGQPLLVLPTIHLHSILNQVSFPLRIDFRPQTGTLCP